MWYVCVWALGNNKKLIEKLIFFRKYENPCFTTLYYTIYSTIFVLLFDHEFCEFRWTFLPFIRHSWKCGTIVVYESLLITFKLFVNLITFFLIISKYTVIKRVTLYFYKYFFKNSYLLLSLICVSWFLGKLFWRLKNCHCTIFGIPTK